jgi:DNA polymerase III epsilon subunit family exonuclease
MQPPPTHTWPTLWADLRVAALDVETTGFDPEHERIIEIGIVTLERGEVVDRWGALINPGKAIPAEVKDLTGISQEDVDDKPPFAHFAAEIQRRLQGVGLCAYNLAFDRSFIDAELKRAGLPGWPSDAPTLDPLIFARELQREHSSKKLGDVAERLGITLENAHRAVDDAEVAGRVMFAFAPQLPESLQDVLILQAQWEVQQDKATSMWRRNDVDRGPSAAFQAVAALGARAVGLGPGYLYGEELDPLRAIYLSVPEIKR